MLARSVSAKWQPVGLDGGPVNGMVRRRDSLSVESGARRDSMKLHVLGIDLGKTVFHLVGLDSTGKAVIRKTRDVPADSC